MIASVIVPTYNQYHSLCKVLYGFNSQNIDYDLYEVIVVDDASSDGTKNINDHDLLRKYQMNVKIIHLEENCGRSVTRNTGIGVSNAELLIFCDGDRVPAVDFISEHVHSHMEAEKIVIGVPYDFFGKGFMDTVNGNFEWSVIECYSRLPVYYKRLLNMSGHQHVIDNDLAFMAFLVGNASLDRNLISKAGNFDTRFDTWGFEHFELGIRLLQHTSCVHLNVSARSYHIPHPREDGFYNDRIIESAKLLKEIHPKLNLPVFLEILLSQKDMNECREKIYLQEL